MNTLCDARRATLIVIDMQERLLPAIRDHALVTNHVLVLQRAARLLQIPVIGTEQNPQKLGPNLPQLHALCTTTISKTAFDACAAPGFLRMLDDARDDLLVAGCETHVCVLQTVLSLLRDKRRVRVVADACGSRQPSSKDLALDRMRAAGAEILTTEMVVFEWLRDCGHPHFREVLALVK